MKLVTAELPQGALEEAQAGVEAAIGTDEVDQSYVLAPERARRGLYAGHALYMLTLDDNFQREGLDAARHVGWRLLMDDGSSDASSDWSFVDLAGTEEPQFSRLHTGEAAGSLVSGIQLAESLSVDRSFSLKSLEIPDVYATLLWLDDAELEWAQDLLIPVRSQIDELTQFEILEGGALPDRLATYVERNRGLEPA